MISKLLQPKKTISLLFSLLAVASIGVLGHTQSAYATEQECSSDVECSMLDICEGYTGSCDTGSGLCENIGIPVCDDLNACNGLETCEPFVGCVAGATLDCDDQDACTDDSCDEFLGCVYAVLVCDDGDACNGEETCDPGTGCVAGEIPDCDDGDA